MKLVLIACATFLAGWAGGRFYMSKRWGWKESLAAFLALACLAARWFYWA